MKLEAIKKMWLRLRTGFGRFAPFNLVAIAVACLMVGVNHDLLSNTVTCNLVRGLYWGALAGVVCRLDGERCESAWHRIAAWPMTILVAALGCWFWFSVVEDSPRYLLWEMVYGGTFIAFAAIGVALLYRIADERTLVSRLVLNLLGVCGSAMIFIGSIELCVLAFDKLVSSVNYRLYDDVFMFAWLTIVPVGFASLLPGKNADSKDGSDRAAAFLFWLLLPASLILLAILYLYLGRILVTRTMPSGELNWFGSIALAVYIFFWLALRDSTRSFFSRFVRWGWTLLIPVLAAQIVGIAIRYNAYGLSAPRLAGMITLAIGIFALFLAAFNRRPRVLFLFIAVVGLVFTVSPFNIIDVPIRNQEARLKAALARYGLSPDSLQKPARAISDEEAKIIYGAWVYLEDASPVYCHPAEVRCIKQKLGEESLFTRLGIDVSKMPNGRTYRGKRSHGNRSCVTIHFAENGKIPVGEYTHVRTAGWVNLHHHGQRYLLKLSVDANGREEEFDVTAHVERIYAAARWDGTLPQKNVTCEVPVATAVWELRPGLAFAICAPNLTFSGMVGRTIDDVSVDGIILSK